MTVQVDNKPIDEKQNIQTPAQSVQPETPKTEPESAQDVNWRNYRQQRELERKQKEEAERRANEKAAEAEALKAAMDAILNKQQTKQNDTSHDPYSEDVSEDERIERKVQAALAKRRQQDDQERAQREQQELPTRLKSHYNDFDQVCSTENLDYLTFHEPDIASAFKNMPDSFDKWSSIYKTVKRFVPNTDARRDMKQMEKNLAKPGSVSSAGATSGPSNMPASQLTEAKKAENYKRMQRAMKGLS